MENLLHGPILPGFTSLGCRWEAGVGAVSRAPVKNKGGWLENPQINDSFNGKFMGKSWENMGTPPPCVVKCSLW